MKRYRQKGTRTARASLASRLARTALIAGLAGVAALAGCSETTGDGTAKGVLRIPFYNAESFPLSYGDYFAVKFPDIEVEIISTSQLVPPGQDYPQRYDSMLREQKPDLLITHSVAEYRRWADQGLLMDLEPFVKRSKFDLDSFTPAAVSQLRMNNENKLFGLAPELTSSALYYNKDLFDRYGVPYPTNRMSWDEVFQLAGRFPVDPDPEKRIYGIHLKYWTPFDFVYDVANTEGAAFISPDGKRMTLESDLWSRAFSHVVGGFRSGRLYYYYKDGKPISYGPNETKQMDLFSANKAAMMINDTEQMFRMKQWGEAGINWDIVTVPIDPANPDYARYFNVAPIYAIAAGAANADAAWEVVRYFNSEEAAKVSQKTDDVLSTRTAFAKTKDGRSLDPFYMLKRKPDEGNSYSVMPSAFYSTFQTLHIREIDEAVNGRKSIEEALRTIQTEGQALLDQARAEEAAANP